MAPRGPTRREEIHAEKYLNGLSLGTVEFEPIPNEPPDFVIAGTIAVEVRRLNENVPTGVSGGKLEGLEQAEIPLAKGMRELAASFGPPRGNSALLGYRFKRPIDGWKKTRPMVQAELERFLGANPRSWVAQKELTPQFWLTIQPLSFPLRDQFSVSLEVDEDSGGWVLELIRTNVALISAEKNQKVAKNRGRWSKWWLVLVDAIGLGNDPGDQALLKAEFNLVHSWDRIVILNAADPAAAVVL